MKKASVLVRKSKSYGKKYAYLLAECYKVLKCNLAHAKIQDHVALTAKC